MPPAPPSPDRAGAGGTHPGLSGASVVELDAAEWVTQSRYRLSATHSLTARGLGSQGREEAEPGGRRVCLFVLLRVGGGGQRKAQ